METYNVLREHLGDRFYHRGDTRQADKSSVAHLVKQGVLALPETKAEPPVLNKAEPALSNKSDPATKARKGASE